MRVLSNNAGILLQWNTRYYTYNTRLITYNLVNYIQFQVISFNKPYNVVNAIIIVYVIAFNYDWIVK